MITGKLIAIENKLIVNYNEDNLNEILKNKRERLLNYIKGGLR